MSYFRNVSVSNWNADAFGRLRISNPTTLFNSKLINDQQPLFWDVAEYGCASATYDNVNACLTMATDAPDAAVIRQTFNFWPYMPGKSQLVMMTFQASQQTDVRIRIGPFEGEDDADSAPQNGVFLQIDDDDVSWNIAKGGYITETVSQISWNTDKLDGTGLSGKTLDLDACQIMWVDFEWLGVGSVRCGFVIDGEFVVCHKFHHANDSTYANVYMRTPDLPLNYSIFQEGSNSGTMDAICSSVISEGGIEDLGASHHHDMGVTKVTLAATATTYALLGIRWQATKTALVIPEFVTAVATSTGKDFLLKFILNPTVAGTFTYSDKTNSALQTATGVVTNTVTNGHVLWTIYVSTDSGQAVVPSRVLPRLGRSIDGTVDELVVCAQPLAINTDVYASISWQEIP